MKMSIESAMEIWRAGGGVAAAEWQEKAGWKRGYPVYRRRPTPCFCTEYTRRDLESFTRGAAGPYWSDILTNITRRFPKVRKIIAVHDPHGLRTACEDAKIPVPLLKVDGTWNLGGVGFSNSFHEAFGPKHEAEPRYVWQDLAKRLASSAVPAS